MTTTSDTSAPGTGHRRALNRGQVTAAAVVLALLVGLLLAVRWWTTPELFDDGAGSWSGTPAPVAEAAVAAAVTRPDIDGQRRTTVTFTDEADVTLSANSARATAQVAVCRARPATDPIGVVPVSDVGEFCEDVVPVTDGTTIVQQQDAGPADYLLVMLTPTRPGKMHVTEVTLRYRTDQGHFYRRGSQDVGLDISMVAR